jgi:hypothetical protein
MDRFLESLVTIVQILQPFICGSGPGSARWDGKAYVQGESRLIDVAALTWWSSLNVMDNLLRGQEAYPTADQLTYLDRELFGGMGSLADFRIDEALFGEEARQANKKLELETDKLYQALSRLKAGQRHSAKLEIEGS